MTDKRKDNKQFSRRDMLRTAGAGVMGGALSSGCASTPAGPPGSTQHPQDIRGTSVKSCGQLASHQTLEAQVVVIGGGLAGVCAAIAAARNGASVVLVQNRPVLGGNSSSEIRMHICGADGGGLNEKTDTRETGIIEELRLEESVHNPQCSAFMWDLLLYDKIRREPNITLLLNTHCCSVSMTGKDRITEVHAYRHGTEDVFSIRGKVFIDCSGDGRIGAEAGAMFRMGREAQSEFGEPIAPPKADHKTLGSSILFMTRCHDRPMPFVAPDWTKKFPDCKDLPHRYHGQWNWGFWWVEFGGELDTIKDDEKIRDELLAAALGVWDHIKNSGHHPESENWAIDWIGFSPGKRESRRFQGDYMLKQRDLQRGEVFADGVAYGGWSIDLHPPEGIYSKEHPCTQIRVPLYGIPFRSLYSRNIGNLLFAGRNISATHVAFGSTRVMATCSLMGQAVGTAAAMCVRQGCSPRTLGRDAIGGLQQQLLKDDAYIIGVANNDVDDLARGADVRTSSEIPGGKAKNIINGIHRGVYEKSNRWISDPTQDMPQWIELRFSELKRLREVHLVFDTGLNRRMTLSYNERLKKQIIRGPQPETVRDYEVQVLSGGNAKTVVQVERNYQRKHVHKFDPMTVDGIRLNVSATNGDKSARVFEIRAYS